MQRKAVEGTPEQPADPQAVIRSIVVPGAGIDLHAVEAPGSNATRIPVLLIHENRGLVPYMIDEITYLAERGHRVVAPDLLTRIGGTSAYANDPTSVSTRQIDTATHVSDLLAAYDWMAEREGRLAVVGFCFGAEMGWQVITRRAPESAVLWYGIGPDPGEATLIRSRVYAAYAQNDDRVNDTLPPLCEALAHADADITLESFPGTRHAFADHTRPERHYPQARARLWSRTLEFLDSA
jgi:carboxymethylenebutenolidase